MISFRSVLPWLQMTLYITVRLEQVQKSEQCKILTVHKLEQMKELDSAANFSGAQQCASLKNDRENLLSSAHTEYEVHPKSK
jgi:hypothetical protein